MQAVVQKTHSQAQANAFYVFYSNCSIEKNLQFTPLHVFSLRFTATAGKVNIKSIYMIP